MGEYYLPAHQPRTSVNAANPLAEAELDCKGTIPAERRSRPTEHRRQDPGCSG